MTIFIHIHPNISNIRHSGLDPESLVILSHADGFGKFRGKHPRIIVLKIEFFTKLRG